MNSPFYPAVVSFGPFLLLMFLLLMMGQQRRKPVPRYPIVVAYAVCLCIGIAGVAVSFWLHNAG